MPLQQTSGNNTTDAYGGGSLVSAKYIEDYFKTWVRAGTGATATITTGINGITNEMMLWIKARSTTSVARVCDTIRGSTNSLVVNSASGQTVTTTGVTAFTTTGYTLGSDTVSNSATQTFVDWSFVSTPKFFDIVTYTGNAANRTIAHNLGTTPGCIIVKPYLSTTGGWVVYHKNIASPTTSSLRLNTTAAPATDATMWNSTAPTSSVFSIGTAIEVNTNAAQYVAYLFADNAGGFGSSGNDSVISCGTFTTSASRTASVNIGYEIQWILAKPAATISNWVMYDNIRDMAYTDGAYLVPNTATAEVADTGEVRPTAVGFDIAGTSTFAASTAYIYIAIRRGPMKVPTDATTVLNSIARTGTGAAATVTTGFVTDAVFSAPRAAASTKMTAFFDRIRGSLVSLTSAATNPEASQAATLTGFDNNTGFSVGAESTTVNNATINRSASTFINWCLQRAPIFFDEVCYSGTGVAKTVSHNLNAVPELIIVKSRSSGTVDWQVYSGFLGNTQGLILNTTAATVTDSTFWNNTTPTSSVFTVGTNSNVNKNNETYIAYLFASCPGVSKVGNYSGTGATQTISCGFTGGARFVMIKRTDSVGDWYVWDTTRGMVAGTDPSILFNSQAAEVNANSVYTATGGFQIVSTAAGINASGGTYIYLAIA